MHRRLAEIMQYADERRAELEAAVSGLPYSRWVERPHVGQWSVAQVFDHLHISESGIARLVAKRIQRAKEAGLGPETSEESMLESLDTTRIVDGPKREAPEIVRPREDARAPEVLDALRRSRADLRAALREGDGLALGDVTATHPALGVINLYQWVLFIGHHEARHARQLREMVRQLGTS